MSDNDSSRQRIREVVRDVFLAGPRVGSSGRAIGVDMTPEMLEALETERMVAQAGLVDIEIERKPGYVEAMTEWNDPLYRKIIEHLPSGSRVSDYLVSVNVTAKKGAVD